MGPNILDKLTLDRKLIRELDLKTLLAIIAIVAKRSRPLVQVPCAFDISQFLIAASKPIHG